MRSDMTAASNPQSTTTTNLARSLSALPPLPASAEKILSCFGDEFIDANEVTAIVEDDPGICARLLGLANSAYFGLAEPVNRVDEAVSRVLGVETVRSLVLAMAIQQSFNRQGCPSFDAQRFWMRSLLTAECCKRIAQADPDSSPAIRDLAYATGLCHNLGLMALVHLEPKAANGVLAAHADADDGTTLVELFTDALDTDHRRMTAVISRSWSLPQPMTAAYECRANPAGGCDSPLGLIVLAAADAVGNAEHDDGRHDDLSRWADRLGLSADELQGMAELGAPHRDRVQSLAERMTR